MKTLVESKETLETLKSLNVSKVSKSTSAVLNVTLEHIRNLHGLKSITPSVESFELTPISANEPIEIDSLILDQTIGEVDDLMETVSIEGIKDAFGDIARNIKHGSKPSRFWKHWSEIKEIAETTYGNPEWLSKRRLITGNIKFKSEVDPTNDMTSLMKSVSSSIIKYNNETKGIYNDILKTVEPAANYLIKGQYKTKPEIVREYIFNFPKWDSSKGPKPTKSILNITAEREYERPALNANQIASLVKELLDAMNAYYLDSVASRFLLKDSKWKELFKFEYEGEYYNRFTSNLPKDSKVKTDVIAGIDKVEDEYIQNQLYDLSNMIGKFIKAAEDHLYYGEDDQAYDLHVVKETAFRWIEASVK